MYLDIFTDANHICPLLYVFSFPFYNWIVFFSCKYYCINFVVKNSNIVLSIINYLHVVSFHILTFQMFVLTGGSLTRLVYQLFSDCQYQLLFLCLSL